MNASEMQSNLQNYFSSKKEVEIAILYGSFAKNRVHKDSDLDIAVAYKNKMSPQEKILLIEELSLIALRPIDLVDLHSVHAPLSQEIYSKGKILKNINSPLLERLVKNMLYEVADFLPLKRKEQKKRLAQFLGETE